MRIYISYIWGGGMFSYLTLRCEYVIVFAIAITYPRANTRFVVFSRDKTELNELVCGKQLGTLLHHAGLVSQEEPVSNINEMPVNYEGNNKCYYTESTIDLGGRNVKAA
jgi:hypothetical protein